MGSVAKKSRSGTSERSATRRVSKLSMRNFEPILESQALKRMMVDVLPQNVCPELEEEDEDQLTRIDDIDGDEDDDDVVADGQMTTEYDAIKYDEISVAESESDDGESSDGRDRQPLRIMVLDDQGHRQEAVSMVHDHHFVMDDNAKSKSVSLMDSEQMAEPNGLELGDESLAPSDLTQVAAAHIIDDEESPLYGQGDEHKMFDFEEQRAMIRRPRHREGRPEIHTRSNSHDCSTNMSLLREPMAQRKSTWDSGVSDLFGVGGNEPNYNPFGGATTSVATFTSPAMRSMRRNHGNMDYMAVDRGDRLLIDGDLNQTTTMGLSFEEDDDDSSDSPSNVNVV